VQISSSVLLYQNDPVYIGPKFPFTSYQPVHMTTSYEDFISTNPYDYIIRRPRFD